MPHLNDVCGKCGLEYCEHAEYFGMFAGQHINNCAVANGKTPKDCQMCKGRCIEAHAFQESKPEPGLKPNTYVILRRAVEEGVATGYRRSHKHTDEPGENYTVQCIEEAVMDSIAEVFTFTDEEL